MGSLKVNITCGGENMEVKQLKIEPDNWHHRFEISVVSKMENNKNIINIEMNEVSQEIKEEKLSVLKPTKTAVEPKPAVEEIPDSIDGSVWL